MGVSRPLIAAVQPPHTKDMLDPNRRYRILDPTRSYSFSNYFDLPYAPEDILADLGYTVQQEVLRLPTGTVESGVASLLQTEISRNMRLVSLLSETARRETIVAPMLLALCDQLQAKLYIEYAIRVNDWLKGSFDYYVQAPNGLLVVEAKQSDLTKGFTQLGAELIALDQWTDSTAAVLYGVVTTGEIWKFGLLKRTEKALVEDRNLYLVPRDLESLTRFLAGIISGIESLDSGATD